MKRHCPAAEKSAFDKRQSAEYNLVPLPRVLVPG
jgi:hypothetical protein